jgi:hypothetical protein
VAGPQIRTTARFAAEIIDHPLFRGGEHTTGLVDQLLSERAAAPPRTAEAKTNHTSPTRSDR